MRLISNRRRLAKALNVATRAVDHVRSALEDCGFDTTSVAVGAFDSGRLANFVSVHCGKGVGHCEVERPVTTDEAVRLVLMLQAAMGCEPEDADGV